MNRKTLTQSIIKKKSFLCVGLDTDLDRIPPHLLEKEDPIFEFNKAIIDATKDVCVAYKPNTAFYECYGEKGWRALRKTIDYISDDHFVIADAKRGDIGNTSQRYAKAFFEDLKADAITVAPYMGRDSVSPFLELGKGWVVLLALTSNKGSKDFQFLQHEGIPFYEKVLTTSQEWGTEENLMYVVGATHPENFKRIRELVPNHFLLVPGIGAQGGDLAAVASHALNKDIGILVNSSRGIIYASQDYDFDQAARAKAQNLQTQMQSILESHHLI